MTPVPAPAVVPIVLAPGSLDHHPAAVYLAGKPSAVGRRGLQRSLNRAAELLTSGATTDALAVNWAEVRYQHVMALRAVLIEERCQAGDYQPRPVRDPGSDKRKHGASG